MKKQNSVITRFDRVLSELLRPLGQWSRNPTRCAVLLFVLGTGLGALLTLYNGWPVPTIHDEFGYLLGADTFAHGRLTNPTPPGWEHFESFHVLQQPSYAPKFPPASFVTMGLTQALFGEPLIGVWLANGLLAAMAFWALCAWVPGRWALLGALLTAANPMTLRWSQCYWGGTLAAIGGALVLGSFGRLKRAPRPGARDSLLLGAGLLVLANSRPFEGLLLALVTAVALAGWLVRATRPIGLGTMLRRFVLPVTLTLAVGGAGMGFYNFRVTGSAHVFPYMQYEKTHSEAPLFIWQQPRPPMEYRHQAVRDLNAGWAMDEYRSLHRRDKWPGKIWAKFNILLKTSSWDYALLLPGLIALWRWRQLRGTGYAAAIIVLISLALLGLTYPLLPHYAAPFLVATLLLQLQGMRWLQATVAEGPRVATILLSGCVLMLGNYWFLTVPTSGAYYHRTAVRARTGIMHTLTVQGGRHLLFIRYAPDHDPHDEWVYNGADISGAPILWARDMGTEQNARLIESYPGRTAWLLEPDKKSAVPVPYQ